MTTARADILRSCNESITGGTRATVESYFDEYRLIYVASLYEYCTVRYGNILCSPCAEKCFQRDCDQLFSSRHSSRVSQQKAMQNEVEDGHRLQG